MDIYCGHGGAVGVGGRETVYREVEGGVSADGHGKGRASMMEVMSGCLKWFNGFGRVA